MAVSRWLAAAASLVLGSAVWGADTDWPTFDGPRGDNKSTETGLLKQWPAGGPKLLWKADGMGKGYSSPVIADGTIYLTGDEGKDYMLYAFDLTGKLKGKWPAGEVPRLDHDGARGSVTVDGENLYLLNGGGTLMCMSTTGGAMKWSRTAKEFGGSPGGWGYAETPLIYKDWVIFKPGGKNCIVALNKLTGEPVWKSTGFSAGPEYGSCLMYTWKGTDYIVTGTNAGIFCVTAKDGVMVWSNDFSARNTANCPTPQFADGYVFWSNGYGKGCICLKLDDAGKATEAWKGKQMVCHHGGYLINNGYIYGNNEGSMVCLDLKTGKNMWSENAVGKGSLTYADGMLYLFGENGGKAALVACTPEKPAVAGKMTVAGSGPSWAHPVISGGRLYLRYDANLYCFDVKAQ